MSYHRVAIHGKSNSKSIKLADPIAVFTARCQARATLVKSRDYDFIESVDALWAAAVRANLVSEIGTDRIQEIMARAFAPVHSEFQIHFEFQKPNHSTDIANIRVREESAAAGDLDDDYAELTHSFARACRLADAAHAQRTRLAAKPTRRVAESTLEAAEHLLRLGDPERWRAWLADHSADEREAIADHLSRKPAANAQSRTRKWLTSPMT